MTASLVAPVSAPPAIATPDTLEIVVALRHIKQGQRGYLISCAVALALREDGYDVTWVNTEGVCLRADVRYRGTPEFRAWVRAFDMGSPVFAERFILRRREGSWVR